MQHLRLAIALQKPLFIHEREAHSYLIEQISPYLGPRLPPVVVHCFTGEKEELKAYVDLGFYIGITGFVAKQKRGAGTYVSVL